MTNRFDQEAARWDQEPRRLAAADAIADAMIRALSLDGRQVVLDYGTGTGLIALKLRPHVARVVAVDNSPGMLAVLRQKLDQGGITAIEPRQWSVGQATKGLPTFDVIVSSMTLHHIKDTAAVAAAFQGLLSPGGQLALADLDEDHGQFHADPRGVEHHGFDRTALQRLFEHAGFASLRFHEAHTIVKPAPDGRERPFPIFLMTARKV